MEGRWENRPLADLDSGVAGEPLHSARRPSRRMLFALVLVVAGIAAVCWWRRSRPTDRGGEDQPNLAEARPESLLEEAPTTLPSIGKPSPDAPSIPQPDAPIPKTVPGLMEEAEGVVVRLVQRFPDDPYALDCMAKARFYLGNVTAASEYWDRCLALDPRAAFAWEGLGRVAASKGEYEEAAAAFRKAMELRPELPDTAWLSETACQLAEVLMKLGEVEEAIAVLEESIRVSPESAMAHLLLGQLHLQVRKYEKAKQHFEEVIRVEPTLSHAHFGLANALSRAGRREESLKCLERFQKLRARESNIRRGVRAKEEEPRVLARTVAKTYRHAGQIYQGHGDLQEAERHWRRAAVLSPRYTGCRMSLAILYEQTNRLPEALEMYRQLAAIEPANASYSWRSGMLSVRLGQFEPAEAAFKRVVELAPDSAQGHAALAELYLHSNQKVVEAKKLAEEAVRLDPVAPYYALLSRACARTGDEAGAKSAAEKAMELHLEKEEHQRQEPQVEPGK
jgi:tetratricopeptide (TPR) repeat protein